MIGLPVEILFLGLLSLTSLAVVVLMRVVGVILAIALLTLPAATSRQWTASLGPMMAGAVALCAGCTVGGLLPLVPALRRGLRLGPARPAHRAPRGGALRRLEPDPARPRGAHMTRARAFCTLPLVSRPGDTER